MRNPPILILDEATAALDSINDAGGPRDSTCRGGGRSVIVVAHRLSTLRYADQILVFEAGQIVERGTFDEFLRARSLFARMARPGKGHRKAAGVPDKGGGRGVARRDG